jgi:tetratricopeptide (TPR) repeat protein
MLQQAITADPAAVQPRVALANAHLQRFSDSRDKSILAEARKILDDVAAAQPDLPELHASRENIDRIEGRYDAAARQLALALKADPENHIFHRWLALVYDASGRDSEAVTEFQKCIGLQPRDWACYIDFAGFHHRHGRFREAARLLEEAADFAPNHAQLLAALRSVYLELRRPAESARYSSRSCDLSPGRICYENWGLALHRLGRTAQAIAHYEQALAFGNPSVYLYLMLADAYAYQHDTSRAREYFRLCAERAKEELTTNLKNSGMRAYLAYSKAQLGDREGALFEIEQALRDSPRNKHVMKYGVLTYESLGLRDKALETLRGSTRQVLEDIEQAWTTRQLHLDKRYAQVRQEVMTR